MHELVTSVLVLSGVFVIVLTDSHGRWCADQRNNENLPAHSLPPSFVYPRCG